MKTFNKADLAHPDNKGVIAYLDELAIGGGMVHPDVDEKMRKLGGQIKAVTLGRYERSYLIVHDPTGLILAAAYGTAYSIRTGTMVNQAKQAGAKAIHAWSDGTVNDLADFGDDWVVGSWHEDEPVWMGSVV